MKIKASVIAVETLGDKLAVKLQGSAGSDPTWAPQGVFTLQLHASPRVERSYWVGREVEIEVTPK